MKIRQIPRGWLYTAIRICSLGALAFASMLAVDYYFVAHTFCEEGASCAVVAQSDFGQKYGIFLPTLGLVAYSFFFLTSFFFARTKEKVMEKSLSTFWIPLAIICCAIGAMAFIIIQAVQIHAFCWLCMGIDTWALISVIPAVLLLMNKTEDDEIPKPATKLHPVFWCAFYLAIACGPIAFGTKEAAFPPPVPEVAADADPVPAFIRSFYVENKINVVEISSFDCPHCRKLHPKLNALLSEYGDKINFTRLTIPLGKNLEACVAYYCAEKQKKEDQFADCLFDNPSKDINVLLDYARQCSINEDSFKQCVTDPESSKAVADMISQIKNSGLQGAPTIWINDRQIVGFKESLGIQPYKDAIENNVTTDDDSEKAVTAFHITAVGLILAIICLIAGIPLTIKSRRPILAKDDSSSKEPVDAEDEKKDENA